MNLKKKLEELIIFFAKNYHKNILTIYIGGLIAVVGHAGYWYLWTYILPQQYDSAFVRFAAIGLFLPFFLKKFIPNNVIINGLFGVYWYVCIGYNLPFLFTYMTLMNNFSGMWLICETMAISMTIILIPQLILFVIVFSIGIIFAYLFFLFQSTEIIFNITHLEYLLVMPMVIIGGILFNFSSKYGELKLKLSQQKTKIFQSLGGSIAHEMRNPLGSIHQSAYILIKKLQEIPQSRKTNRVLISKKDIEEVGELLEIIDHSSIRGNMVIDMILSNIKGKEIDKSEFKIYQISEVVETAIKEFAFAGSAERSKVSSDIQDNFYFKGDENMLVFVLFNLLKNALYYLKAYPTSRIVITTKKENIGDKDFNYLYFKDTGAGIPEDKLEAIFESFMTSGKAEGTGLGLPFCRRVITAFEGEIICNSKLGEYTEFTISFPKLSKEDEEKKEELIVKKDKTDYEALIKEKYGDKIVLLADDQLVNRMVFGNRLEGLGLKVYKAEHGKDVLKILEKRGDKIDIIFMDLQMPEIDGYEATKLIQTGYKNKKGDKFKNFKKYKTIPIIAFTGDDDDETIAKIKAHNMQGCIGKSWNNKGLLGVLDKAIKN